MANKIKLTSEEECEFDEMLQEAFGALNDAVKKRPKGKA
jgi:hypothetical protein